MSYVNQLVCAALRGNTGIPNSCQHNPDLIKWILAVPKGTTFTAAQLADFETTIQAGLVNDTYSSRFHLFGATDGFYGFEDASEDRQQQTFGYGNKVTTRDAQYYWNFMYLDGAMCAHMSYLQFKGREKEFDYIFIDAKRNFMGTFTLGTNKEYLFKGVRVTEFYENNWKPKDGSNETVFMLSVGISNARQLNEDYAFVTADFDIADLNQVKDVRITALGAVSGTGEVNIMLHDGCGGRNLVQLYGSAIANVARFTATNVSTGAAITITATTIGGVAEGSYLIFNMDDTDTDYPSAGGFIEIDLVAPSVLVAASLDYYDGEPLIVEAT
jgi:hypothetical protein